MHDFTFQLDRDILRAAGLCPTLSFYGLKPIRINLLRENLRRKEQLSKKK